MRDPHVTSKLPRRRRAGVTAALGGVLLAPILFACSGGSTDDGASPSTESSTTPTELVTPGDPAAPLGPGEMPSDPSNPEAPLDPTDPATPTTGVDPENPAVPLDPTDPTDPADPQTPSTCAADAPADVGPNVLRRLSRVEYQLTVQQLLGLAAPPDLAQVPEDPRYKGFRSVSSLQGVTTQHVRGFADTAGTLASDLMADAARRDAVIGCSVDAEGCLADFTTRFGRLAFRRTLDATELAELTMRATEHAESPEDEFTFVIESLLTSPSFLFRIETGATPDALSTLSSVELASKLSFTILGRAPDDALLARGESGEFDTAEGVQQAAMELVQRDEARDYFNAFFQQWLDFEEMRSPPVPPEGWSDDLMPQMLEETELLLDDYAWGGADFLEALTANHTYVRPELATFYGFSATGSEASRVEFPAGHDRENTGLLTHPSLIAAKGDGDIIAHRGKWILSTFLCQDLELPVGLLDSLGTELEGLTRTEMLAKRNEDGRCNSCHQVIDPIGIGFAQYDSTGQFDASVDFSDFPLAPALLGSQPPEFSSVAELGAKLKQRPEVPGCLSERVFLYTQGREPAAGDSCSMERVTEGFGAAGHDFRQLLLALATAPEFRLRRAAPPSATE